MTNAIETVYNIKYGKFNQLSRQQSVDCNTLANGCHGGSPMDVLAYASTIGLNLDAEYKYEGYQGSCKENRSTAKVYVEGVYTTISQKKKFTLQRHFTLCYKKAQSQSQLMLSQ